MTMLMELHPRGNNLAIPISLRLLVVHKLCFIKLVRQICSRKGISRGDLVLEGSNEQQISPAETGLSPTGQHPPPGRDYSAPIETLEFVVC
jgi:hypothetical protein